MVRLKGHGGMVNDWEYFGFNSIVVRLKESMPWDNKAYPSPFQFHSGSIKSNGDFCGALCNYSVSIS